LRAVDDGGTAPQPTAGRCRHGSQPRHGARHASCARPSTCSTLPCLFAHPRPPPELTCRAAGAGWSAKLSVGQSTSVSCSSLNSAFSGTVTVTSVAAHEGRVRARAFVAGPGRRISLPPSLLPPSPAQNATDTVCARACVVQGTLMSDASGCTCNNPHTPGTVRLPACLPTALVMPCGLDTVRWQTGLRLMPAAAGGRPPTSASRTGTATRQMGSPCR
jgi:hypothetical protein